MTLSNRTIVNLGDSIFGNFRPPVDVSTFLAEKTGAVVYNGGFGGTRMCFEDGIRDALSMYRLADAIATGDWSRQDAAMASSLEWRKKDYFAGTLERIKRVDFSRVDIVTVAFGTNDFGSGCPVSEPTEPLHGFSGALIHTIETLRNAYPRLEIVLCTPIWRCWLNEDGEMMDWAERHEINGQKLPQFVAKTKEIAKEYGLFCIDNYNGSGICADTRTICFAGKDGTHPTEMGRRMIAEYMAQALCGKYG